MAGPQALSHGLLCLMSFDQMSGDSSMENGLELAGLNGPKDLNKIDFASHKT